MNRRAVGRRAVAMAGVLAVAAAAGLAALQPAARAAAEKAVRAVVAPLLPEQAIPKGTAKAPVPTPKPEHALGGTVKGPDGKPVEGAVVIVKPSREWLPPVTATTDADGRFRLPLPPRTSGPWDVTVDAKALATATHERVAGGTRLVVTLQKGGVITGTVRDGNDGRPLVGARVLAAIPSSLRWALVWQPSIGVKEAQTDKDGRFRIEGLARGRFEVTASTAGYGIGQRRNLAPGSSADLLLFPGAALSGSVGDGAHRPIPGVVVVAQRRTTHGWTWGGTETTDARGRFVVAGAEPGSYLLLTRHPQWAPGLAEVTVEALAESRVDITLRPGANVHGRLVDERDRLVAGKVVIQEIAGQTLPRHIADTLKAETGPDGVFILERVPVGASVLGITASGFAARRLDVDVGPGGRAVDLGNVSLERGLTIAGRVTDQTGSPIVYASLYATPTTTATLASFPSSPDPVRSEADGTFVIGGLETGVHMVTASAPGYVTAGQKADAGSEKPVRLVLVPAGGIAGTVVDARRRPVEDFRVWAERTEQSGNGYGAGNSKNVTAPDGRFLLEDLAEGTYIVRASAPDYAAGTVTGVKVVAARTTDAGRIRLAEGGVVRGSVVDTAGSPVAGATVAAFSGSSWRDRVEGQCDASGLFEIRGVTPGRTTVAATHPSYAEGRVSDLVVDPAQGPTEARVVMSVGGRVQGSVRTRDGTPMGGLRVGVTPRYGEGDPRSGFPALYAVVQNDGSFAIDHVPAGPATATLRAQPSPGVSMSVQTKEIAVPDGQTIEVDFMSREVFVSGRVSRGDTPLSDVRVTARTLAGGSSSFSMSMNSDWGGVQAARPGPQYLTGVAGADGTYELVVLGPGPGWVEVASLDGRIQYTSRSLEVPDVETYSLDLRVGGAPVNGVIVDQASGKGIPRAYVQATARKGEDRAAANAGPDGRFAFELPPGDYRLTTSAEQYANDDSELSVAEGGASGIRLELSRGLLLEGKLVDLSGRPAPRINLVARAGETAPWAGTAVSMEDGSFRFEHLKPRAYTLAGGSAATGFAIRTGVSPGHKDVVLTLRPGGRVRLTVVEADGAPVADAIPSVIGVDGSMVNLFVSSSRTDAMGGVEFTAPQGLVEVEVRKSKRVGKATIEVEAGATVTARIVLGHADGS
jgi:protocatechuate 3,4-dioxygenase beta subunit